MIRAARSFALALALGAVTAPAAEAAVSRTTTDAWSVATPGKPWTRTVGLEIAGQRSWSAGSERAGRALLRVSCEGVASGAPEQALERLVTRERNAIRAAVDGRTDADRGSFEAVSFTGAGGVRWTGFRVSIRAGGRAGASSRFVALHPGFPARRLAYTVAYDESAPAGRNPPGLESAARALAASLLPEGRGLAGGIDEAWLDARAAAFSANIDSAQKLCWSDRPDAPAGAAHLGVGPGLIHGGDFYLLSGSIPRDSLVDAAALEYGAAFDRNGDGRADLLLINRGLVSFADRTRQATIAVCADDDFDGRIDALLVEDGDRDGDGKVDTRILARDRDGDGRPDEARAFVDRAAPGAKDASRIPIAAGQVKIQRAGGQTGASDLIELFRVGAARLEELDRARETCMQGLRYNITR